jgi:hypothetical protein
MIMLRGPTKRRRTKCEKYPEQKANTINLKRHKLTS